MTILKMVSTAAFCGMLVSAGGFAMAAGEGGRGDVFVGRTTPRLATCEVWDFHVVLAPTQNGAADRDFGGYVFAANMQDEMSRVSGKLDKDGKAHLTLTPMHGKGPAGTAEGEMHNGMLMINMASDSCPMTNVPLMMVHMTVGNAG